jgi:hypothetical protein
MRDVDALHLLKTRDYELIKVSFTKFTTKLKIKGFTDDEQVSLKSVKYRKYNEAFYEELLIDYRVEARISQNYRERFIVTPEEIYLVLEMYTKQDYHEHFLTTDTKDIKHEQFKKLFQIAIQNDSMKVAFNIYLRLLTQQDIVQTDMDLFMNALKTHVYHEAKFFFIHQHFDLMSVKQLNTLVDILMGMLTSVRNLKLNPALHQFNIIKYALLIYRVSWKIEKKKIYSLITKVSMLNNYLFSSLEKYLMKQSHIA